jgi:DNA-binding IclR family transcriptional regulator
MSGHSTVDSLAAASGLAVSTVLATLTLLEMRGLVAASFGRYRPRGTLLPTVTAGSSQAQSGSPWQQRDQSPIDSRAASPAGRS